MPSQSLGVSILIPTWRRPSGLVRCLAGVERQSRRPSHVVLAVRNDDPATWAVIDGWVQRLAVVGVCLDAVAVEPGPLTAAMNAGLARTTGDLVALTDDDAEPRADWVERLVAAFDDPRLGGVGGRDWQPVERGDEPKVGTVSRWGRVVGNHHLGVGGPREVELLKGVNCCFRGDELRRIGFDSRLRGKGNVSHWEMSLCLAFRRAGWRLVYDPAIAVDHHVAPRHDGDINARGGFESASFTDAVHNETLALLEHLPPVRRAAFLAWAAAVGTGEAPGLAQLFRLWIKRRPSVLARWRATVIGRAAGVSTFFRSRHGQKESV